MRFQGLQERPLSWSRSTQRFLLYFCTLCLCHFLG